MTVLLGRLWTEDEGQDIAEYAVMLAVILGARGRHDSPGRLERQQCLFQRGEFASISRVLISRVLIGAGEPSSGDVFSTKLIVKNDVEK